MNKIITWLKNHPLWNVIICIVYYLMVVLPHEWVGVTIAGLFQSKSRLYYNSVILALAIGLGLIVIIPLIKRLRAHDLPRVGWMYLLSLIGFIVLTFNTLIIVNIELIHIIQYAVFAVLVYPMMNGYTVVLLFTSGVGALDEAYQYFYLSPERTDYYDLNDVIINTLGGACGLLWLWSHRYISAYRQLSEIIRSWQLWAIIATLGVLVLLILVGKVAYLPTEGIDTLWTLVRKVPDGYWTSIDKNTITYHITLPLEGLLYCCCLWMIYGTMDYTSRLKH